jgi:hypothetical protein
MPPREIVGAWALSVTVAAINRFAGVVRYLLVTIAVDIAAPTLAFTAAYGRLYSPVLLAPVVLVQLAVALDALSVTALARNPSHHQQRR